MTENPASRANISKFRKKVRALPSFRHLSFCLMSLFTFALLLKNSQLAIKYMSEALSMCATRVLPSLFPFMVFSDLLVRTNAASLAEKLLERPARALLGIGGKSASAILLGALCGFPVGARCACSLYDRDGISKDELDRLMCFCNLPSPAFIINVAGISLFSSKKIGIFLYFSLLVSSLLAGVLSNILSRKRKQSEAVFIPQSKRADDVSPVAALTLSVSGAAHAVIEVCGFILFFNTLVGTLSDIFAASHLSPLLRASVFCIFELTSGISAASALPLSLSLPLCAFASAWSGISVHFQIMSIASGRDVSFARYILSKLLSGALCAITVYLWLPLL